MTRNLSMIMIARAGPYANFHVAVRQNPRLTRPEVSVYDVSLDIKVFVH